MKKDERKYDKKFINYVHNRGLTALPPRGGPWKLESGSGQNSEANTELGGGRGCFRRRALFVSHELDVLRCPPPL